MSAQEVEKHPNQENCQKVFETEQITIPVLRKIFTDYYQHQLVPLTNMNQLIESHDPNISVDYELSSLFVDYYETLREIRTYGIFGFTHEKARELISRLMPFITEEEIDGLFDALEENISIISPDKIIEIKESISDIPKDNKFQWSQKVDIDCPPLFLDHTFHKVHLNYMPVYLKRDKPQYLKTSELVDINKSLIKITISNYSYRLKESYPDNIDYRGFKDSYENHKFAKRAVDYARTHWKLHILPPYHCQFYCLADPKVETKDKGFFEDILHLAGVGVLTKALKSFETYQGNQIIISFERQILNEFAEHTGISSRYCIYCGDSLGSDSCRRCNISFKRNYFYCTEITPIPELVLQYIYKNDIRLRLHYFIPYDRIFYPSISVYQETLQKHKEEEEKWRRQNPRIY